MDIRKGLPVLTKRTKRSIPSQKEFLMTSTQKRGGSLSGSGMCREKKQIARYGEVFGKKEQAATYSVRVSQDPYGGEIGVIWAKQKALGEGALSPKKGNDRVLELLQGLQEDDR